MKTLSLASLPTILVLLCRPAYGQGAPSTSGAPAKAVTQFAYRGMYLGMTVREFSNNYRSRLSKEGWTFEGDPAPSEENCAGMGRCALLSPEVWNLKVEPSFTHDGRLYFLSLSGFSSDNTSDFVRAFTKKYGQPRQETLKYQNAFGAVYSGRRWLWFRGSARNLSMLTIEENCRKLDTPCICLTQGKLAEQADKEDNQALSVE